MGKNSKRVNRNRLKRTRRTRRTRRIRRIRRKVKNNIKKGGVLCKNCDRDLYADVGERCPLCEEIIQATIGPTTSEIIVTMKIKYSGKITDPTRERETYSSPNHTGFSSADKTLINKLLKDTGLPELT